MAFLKSVEKLGIPPRPFLINRESRDLKKGLLNIRSFSIGDDYAKAVGQSLSKLNPYSLNMAANRITSKGAVSILEGIPNSKVQEINFADNKFNQDTIKDLISKVIEVRGSKIKQLNLSKNKLGDIAVKLLCQSLFGYKTMQRLDLSRTDISNEGGKYLGMLIEQNQELRQLDLQWNKIRGQGGIYIAQGLA